jgi:uncharacterized protein
MLTSKIRYILIGLVVYIAAISYLHFYFHIGFNEFLPAFFIVGGVLTFISWFITKNLAEPDNKAVFKRETWVLIALVAWIVFYITYGGTLIDRALPGAWIENERSYGFIILIRKLLIFVAVPYMIYSFFGFSWKDFGLQGSNFKFFSKKGIVLFFFTSIVAILFQYYFSNAGKAIQTTGITTNQISFGIPLAFSWLLLEAGLVEEFFFRALLQSRLSVLLKSATGGIIVTSIIFGLSHAPGLYLRSAESEGISEQLPLLFFGAYTVVYMSIAGIFLGVIWNKTKNLWLVMAIHAVVDLLPFLKQFFLTWHIN